MPKVTWKLADGTEITAQVVDGSNMMNAAVNNNVTGVVGECGGCLSCATCHVYVDEGWRSRVGPPPSSESSMLDATEAPRTDASRLSCQIVATPELDGLILFVP